MAAHDLRRGRGAGHRHPHPARTRWPPAASATPSCSPGARGVGKTTTARILAKALNCAKGEGPTAEPCGECASCLEIAAGTVARRAGDRRRHQQRRRAGARAARERALQPGARPLQDLDHRRGPHALHGRLQRAPEDAGGAAAAGEVHLRHHRVPQDPRHHPLALPAVRLPPDPRPRAARPTCARWRTGEKIKVSDEALARIARAAEGSARDALSLFDQVLSFSGDEVRDEDVSALLGLIDRELLLAASRAVADGDSRGAARAGGAPGRLRRRLPQLRRASCCCTSARSCC